MFRTLLLTLPAVAVVSVGNAAMEPETPATPTTQCADGKVYDTKTEKCVEPSQSGLDDETLFGAGREYARSGQYAHAIAALDAIADQRQARVQTLLGYSLRKSGDLESGLGHYADALALAPDYHLARAYLGMALLEQGDLVGALARFREIEAHGGRGTHAHAVLRDAIVTGTTYE